MVEQSWFVRVSCESFLLRAELCAELLSSTATILPL